MRFPMFAVVLALGTAACQPPPPPPPSRPVTASSPRVRAPLRPIVIFFQSQSAVLDDPATKIIAQAVRQAKARPDSTVHVLGFAAPDGLPGNDTANLSGRRGAAVADALERGGVERERILIEPRGEIPFRLAPIESRRVSIVIGD